MRAANERIFGRRQEVVGIIWIVTGLVCYLSVGNLVTKDFWQWFGVMFSVCGLNMLRK